MGNPTPWGAESREVRALSTWRRWLSRLAELLSMASLIAWSVAVVLVMWSAVVGTPAVALDSVWLLAASALLSSASLLLAMGLGRETATDPGPGRPTTTFLDTDRALD
jgi:hypothetical protein